MEEKEPIKGLSTKLVVIVVVAVVLIGGIGGYFIGKGIDKKEPPQKEKTEKPHFQEQEPEKPTDEKAEKPTSNVSTKIEVDKTCGEAKKGNICIKKINLGGHEEELRIVPDPNIVDPNVYEYKSIAINGIIIYDAEVAKIGEITILDDILILNLYCTNCGGLSAGTPQTVIIDSNGDEIYKLYDVKFENGFEYETYTVKDNEIIITATGVGFREDYLPMYDCYFKTITTGLEGIDGSKKFVNGSNYDTYSNTLAKAEYKLPYLGKKKFSSAVKIKEIKFGELYTKSHCAEEYQRYLKEKDNY